MVQARQGQFQIYYRNGADHLEYQPDFVAETGDTIYMLEPKKRTEVVDAIVIAKRKLRFNGVRMRQIIRQATVENPGVMC